MTYQFFSLSTYIILIVNSSGKNNRKNIDGENDE